MLFAGSALSQQQSDLMLLKRANFDDPTLEEYKPTYTFANSGPLIKYNPISLSFGGLMFFYQRFLSVQISSQCLYHTSCSKFGVELIRHYGLFKGTALTADRLTRCSQFGALDYNDRHFDPESGRVKEAVEHFETIKHDDHFHHVPATHE